MWNKNSHTHTHTHTSVTATDSICIEFDKKISLECKTNMKGERPNTHTHTHRQSCSFYSNQQMVVFCL